METMTDKDIIQKRRYLTALTIAGLDPSGGAGLIADIKTFAALGVYGMGVATALTEQNTRGVTAVNAVDADIVYKQAAAVMSDIKTDTVKIGMVHDAKTVEAIARVIEEYRPRHVVIDPVMCASSGRQMMRDDALQAFISRLLPLATIITPNIPEADRLASFGLSARGMAQRGTAVLLKGGHNEGEEKTDILYFVEDNEVRQRAYTSKAVATRNTHGTGCTLSSAIAAYLARGLQIGEAVGEAKRFLTQALQEGADVSVGHGHGSLNHTFNPERLIKTHL